VRTPPNMVVHVGVLVLVVHGCRTCVSCVGPMAAGGVFRAGEASAGVSCAVTKTGTASSDTWSMAAVSMITA
jgi:hypothetical protein